MPGINAADSHASSCCAERVFSCSVSSRSLIASRMPLATARVASVRTLKRSMIASPAPSIGPARSARCTSFDTDASRASCSRMFASLGSVRSAVMLLSKAAWSPS